MPHLGLAVGLHALAYPANPLASRGKTRPAVDGSVHRMHTASRPACATDTRVFRIANGYLRYATASGALFVLIPFARWHLAGHGWTTFSLFLGMTLIPVGLWLIVGARALFISVGPDGIVYRSIMGRTSRVRWQDVRRVDLPRIVGDAARNIPELWVELQNGQARRFRIAVLENTNEILRLVNQRSPSGVRM
jgi:hypothetical protein